MQLGNLGKDIVQSLEGSALEIHQVLSVSRAALYKHNEWVIFVSRLALSDSLVDKLLDLMLALLILPGDNKALSGFNHLAHGVVVSSFNFGNEA